MFLEVVISLRGATQGAAFLPQELSHKLGLSIQFYLGSQAVFHEHSPSFPTVSTFPGWEEGHRATGFRTIG